MFPVLAVLDLSINNVLAILFIIVIMVILFVAFWRLIAPQLGQYANFVAAIIIVVALFIIAKLLGIF